MLANADPLSALHDIVLPNELEKAPPALAWWLLGGVLCLLLLLGAFFFYRYWQGHRPIRMALASLSQLSTQDALQRLLKQVALSYFPRAQVAQLHGEAWLHFLDAQLPQNAQGFALDPLWLCHYQSNPPAPSEAQRTLAALWIKTAPKNILLRQCFFLDPREVKHV